MIDAPITDIDREMAKQLMHIAENAVEAKDDYEWDAIPGIARAIAKARQARIDSVVGDRLDAMETGRSEGVQAGREEAAVVADKARSGWLKLAKDCRGIRRAANEKVADAIHDVGNSIRALGDKT